jgi:hypothetical protein
MPVTAFYDARGKLLGNHIGLLPEEALRTAIRQLYGNPPGTLTGHSAEHIHADPAESADARTLTPSAQRADDVADGVRRAGVRVQRLRAPGQPPQF